MTRSIAELRGLHAGRTITVVGSGAELNDLDPSDFAGAITVTMNRVPLVWPIRPTYALTKYHADARELRDVDVPLVVGRGDRGYLDDGDVSEFPDAHVFDHVSMMPHGTFTVAEHWPVGDTALVVGPTVQMTALHFAAHLGASVIEVRGCGGHGHVDGYYEAGVSDGQAGWLDDIREVVRVSARELVRRYRVTIIGLP